MPVPTHHDDRSTRVTRAISNVTASLGSFPAILLSVLLIVAWVVGGLFVEHGFGSDNYRLLVSTISAIVTFLMVFIIQNTQNREGRATQAKLDAQNQALCRIEQRLGIEEDGELLTGLIGVEDAPAAEIASEQNRVRSLVRERRTR